jgi:hypothetical protein
MDPELLRGMPKELFEAICTGYERWCAGDPVAASATLKRTLTPAAGAATPTALLGAHHLLGNSAYTMGDLRSASQHHRCVLHESRALNLILGIASATHSLGLIAEREGDLGAARRQIREALRLYLQIRCESGVAAARMNLARLEEGVGPVQL